MKTKLFKIIKAGIYTFIFIISLFPIKNIFAQSAATITLTASPPSFTLPGTSVITATLSNVLDKNILKGGSVISFTTNSSNGDTLSFSNKTCTLPAVQNGQIQFCSVNFSVVSSVSDSFHIGASFYANLQDFNKGITNQISNVNIVPVDVNVVSPYSVNDANINQSTDTTYDPLAPLPGLGKFDTKLDPKTNPCPFGNYLNIIIKVIIGFSAVLAMVMIVVGGIEYLTSELVSGKEAGRETITNAILGLLIALGAYLILNTINPKLLSACLNNLPEATITILPFDENVNSYITKTDSASCKIINSGDCSVSNLQNYFGSKAEAASKICSVESGGRADKKSGSDYCTNSAGDKTTFSFGLFQINLLANGDKIPTGNCANLFTTDAGEEIGYGKASYVRKENGKIWYDCKLKPNRGNDYNNCVKYLLTPTGNLEMAKKLFNKGGNAFGDWKLSDSGVCPSAFQ